MTESNRQSMQRVIILAAAVAALEVLPQAALAQASSAGTQRGIIAILKPGGEKQGFADGSRSTMKAKTGASRKKTRGSQARAIGGVGGRGSIGIIKPGGTRVPAAQKR